MLSVYVRKHLRVKSELGFVVLDARDHQVCPHDSPRSAKESDAHSFCDRGFEQAVTDETNDRSLWNWLRRSLGSMNADYEATGYPSEYGLWYNNWWTDLSGRDRRAKRPLATPESGP
jgi:hypothetical protein